MFRQANTKDATALTKLSFDSKGYWDYPGSYFNIWADELTVSTGDTIVLGKVEV